MNDLKQKAIALGLCAEFQAKWSDESSYLVDMYKTGVTWCLANKYPSLVDMLLYDELLAENNVFNSRLVDLFLNGDTYVFNDCSGKLEINDYNVARAYFGLNSNVKITAKDESYLYLDLYDNTNIQLVVEGNANVTAYCYGNSVVQILSGTAKIIRK